MPMGSPDIRKAEPQTRVGRWQSEEVGAIELLRHKPRVDPNSTDAKTRPVLLESAGGGG
jgi:hypothetical protein